MIDTQIILNEIRKQKELSIFYDILNSLPSPKGVREELEGNEKIPVVLSSDDNYACFVAVTGVSILYNTKSFIEFYVLSDNISDAKKKLIQQSFENVTPHFSLTFVECNAAEDFSDIKLPENYHVKINTCNRLLVPKLIPSLSRAIYLDIDLVVLDDIKKLWDEDLNGHIFGCVPLYFDRYSTVEYLRSCAGIPADKEYFYFNSGVMLIDYDRWRKKCGGNKEIIDSLFAVLATTYVQVTPDEVILNRFAYDNGKYCVLPHKYNTHAYYSYIWLKRNKKQLSEYENNTLIEYEKLISEYYNEQNIAVENNPVIHHFYGHEKPWREMTLQYLPILIQEHFSDFWFYSKLSLFFEEVKKMFIETNLRGSDLAMYALKTFDEVAVKNKLKYYRYKLLSKLTFGKTRKRYKKKYKELNQKLKEIKSFLNK